MNFGMIDSLQRALREPSEKLFAVLESIDAKLETLIELQTGPATEAEVTELRTIKTPKRGST